MENTRQKKISRLIQKELSSIFIQKSRSLFEGSMISVTVVRVTPDLSFARVYLSIFPAEKAESVFKLVELNSSKLRFELGNIVKNQLRKVPDLQFHIDDSLDYIENIENLLKK